MEQIGFNNFRKFAEFPPLDLAPITILVGENNAGKSTVVKGILALSDFLNRPSSIGIEDFDAFDVFDDGDNDEDKALQRKKITIKRLQNIKFRFNTSYLAHIGTFKRALYNKADSNAITFHTKLGHIFSSFTVKGNPKDEEAVSGNLAKLDIRFEHINVALSFDLEHDSAIVSFNPNVDFHSTEGPMKERFEKYFSSFSEPVTFSLQISDYWSIFRGDLIGSLIEVIEDAVNATLVPDPSTIKTLKDEERLEYMKFRRRHFGEEVPRLNLPSETVEFLKRFSLIFNPIQKNKEEAEGVEYKFTRFNIPGGQTRFFFARNVDIEYLYAHAVTQTVIYSAKDTNDYLSRTIHQYASQKEKKYKREFIQRWMKEFGIGVDYKIKSVGGEAHIVHIVNKDGEEVNLADKGMGSIQLMVLLFRLAISLPTDAMLNAIKQERIKSASSIIIIEEPEQNLHPMLQSKLADLLFELNTKYRFRFIIETHSEYLVRRSQVIVGDNFDTEEKLKDNPFKVYYFPTEGAPYDMGYTTSGQFEKKFGDGFINEAGKLHMAVLKNSKKQN